MGGLRKSSGPAGREADGYVVAVFPKKGNCGKEDRARISTLQTIPLPGSILSFPRPVMWSL